MDGIITKEKVDVGILEKVREAREKRMGAELLKLSDSLTKVDEDVADLCLALEPEDDQLISMADLMTGMQDIKNKLVAKAISNRVYYCQKCDRFTDVNYIRDKQEKKGTRAKSFCYKCGDEMLEPVEINRKEGRN